MVLIDGACAVDACRMAYHHRIVCAVILCDCYFEVGERIAHRIQVKLNLEVNLLVVLIIVNVGA